MADLLVLSLTETTRRKDGYEIIAKNMEDGEWVIIPALSSQLMFDAEKKAQWDIFAVTKADIRLKVYENRSGVYDVIDDNYFPRMITEPMTDYGKRTEILDSIAKCSINEINKSKEWVGLLKNPIIKDIIFRLKTQEFNFDSQKTFYWECRIEFDDIYGEDISYGQKLGTVCKDMRFKSYWKDIMLKRPKKLDLCKSKWIEHMNSSSLYFVIEYIPNLYYGSIGMVSGIICIHNDMEVDINEHV